MYFVHILIRITCAYAFLMHNLIKNIFKKFSKLKQNSRINTAVNSYQILMIIIVLYFQHGIIRHQPLYSSRDNDTLPVPGLAKTSYSDTEMDITVTEYDVYEDGVSVTQHYLNPLLLLTVTQHYL